MLKRFFILSFLCLVLSGVRAQDTTSDVLHRIIFIGDAGEINAAQSALINEAADKIIIGKTDVFFTGNNIYPRGFREGNESKKNHYIQILASQYKPMRQKGAPVYFLPGTRDWDNSGPDGLQNITAFNNYILSLNDSLIKVTPDFGCPDPQVVQVSENLIVVTMDTEWWLYPFDKSNTDTACDCTTERDVLGGLRKILNENQNKTIILATHHPFSSLGRRSGKFSLKDNLFPLTRIEPSLYLPLPLAGSLYPAFKKVFPGREDLKHSNYRAMVRQISGVFSDFPNLIQVSGHEDGIQLLNGIDSNQLQAVVGIGNKPAYTTGGKSSLYNSSNPGFVVVDQLNNHQTRITLFAYRHHEVNTVFQYIKPFQPVKISSNPVYTPITEDSVTRALHPSYGTTGKFSQFLLGKNYRTVWSSPAKIPVIRLSEIDGGLTPIKLGGGFQTISLRMKNLSGKEYVLRKVDKEPDKIIPQEFLSPLTRQILIDAYSSQNPFSALVVPPISDAVGVPAAHPEIGLVSPDTVLGPYQALFAGQVSLLEEREPLPKTDNFTKAFKELKKDNDNSYDAINFYKARMLDLLIGDWDRHSDQWRFSDAKKGSGKYYVLVPRDRDQALSVTNGLFETIVRYFFMFPPVHGFKKNLLQESNAYMQKSTFMQPYAASHINYDVWMKTAQEFRNQVTDSVLQEAVNKLPTQSGNMANEKILSILKARRDLIPAAMDKYYRYNNRIVDIRGTDKKEFVSISGTKDSLHILMQKISKKGELKDTMMSTSYASNITKEVRVYLGEDEDSVYINNLSPVRLRLIGDKTKKSEHKSYFIANSRKKIKLYDYREGQYYGNTGKLKKQISKDTTNTRFVQVNMLNTMQPLLTAAINPDDGFMLGVGARLVVNSGFRKEPFASDHRLMINHSFSTKAFSFNYQGDWVDVIGKAHFVLDADVKAPDNTQNFFGVGNETPFDKTGDFMRFYRTRFDLLTVRPSLKWENINGNSFTIGPEMQFYHLNPNDNIGRLILNEDQLHSSDSSVITEDKLHIGITAEYELDKRNNPLIPTYGAYFHVLLQGFPGVNSAATGFTRIAPEFALYKNLNARQTIVLADRVGGAVTTGKPAFYQYAYLGGQGNLMGYRKFRFAGMHTFYNNLELRIALADFANSVFKGQIGLTGFYDVGRVWATDQTSSEWHHGTGGGLYITPAYSAVIRFQIGFTSEGIYPSFGFGFRF